MTIFSKKYLEYETIYTKILLDVFYSLPDCEEKEKIRTKILEKREEFKITYGHTFVLQTRMQP